MVRARRKLSDLFSLHLSYLIPFSYDITSQMVNTQTYEKNETFARERRNIALRKPTAAVILRRSVRARCINTQTRDMIHEEKREKLNIRICDRPSELYLSRDASPLHSAA